MEPRFWDNFEICLLYVHKHNKYLPHVVDNIIFGISVLDYHILTVGTTILGQFWNLCSFCLLYIHINNIKFTYDKLKSVKFGFSIFDKLSSSFMEFVNFADWPHKYWDTNILQIRIWIQHSILAFPSNGQTDGQTDKRTNGQTDKRVDGQQL